MSFKYKKQTCHVFFHTYDILIPKQQKRQFGKEKIILIHSNYKMYIYKMYKIWVKLQSFIFLIGTFWHSAKL